MKGGIIVDVNNWNKWTLYIPYGEIIVHLNMTSLNMTSDLNTDLYVDLYGELYGDLGVKL